jgi:hypothetical protein
MYYQMFFKKDHPYELEAYHIFCMVRIKGRWREVTENMIVSAQALSVYGGLRHQ